MSKLIRTKPPAYQAIVSSWPTRTNVSDWARILGTSAITIKRRIEKFGIQPQRTMTEVLLTRDQIVKLFERELDRQIICLPRDVTTNQ